MPRLKIDELKKLHQKKYRYQYDCFLAEGEHLVLELEKAAKTNAALLASQLYVTEAYQGWASNLTKTVVGDRAMAQLSDTKSPQGIVACVPVSALSQTASKTDAATPRAVYLYETQDPGNLGTILRTLGWFGGFTCLLSPGCVDPFNTKVVRSSMGAIFNVAIELNVELSSLSSRYSTIACLDMQGDRLSSESFQQAQCLVFGNEARGVPREQLQALGAASYTIPGRGEVESLNVASALNMCLYELNRLS